MKLKVKISLCVIWSMMMSQTPEEDGGLTQPILCSGTLGFASFLTHKIGITASV